MADHQQQPPGPARAGRRLLLVHAHPDDETITTGATMARYAAQGAHVCLVTCTLGQLGEVIPADLQHLSADGGDDLGAHRRGELAAAMRALGVHDHRVLGDGAWRDSGMVWLEPGLAGVGPDVHPHAFAVAPLEETAGALADVVREVRPQVVVTYDPQGGYGHPDHVQAHRVTMAAVEAAAGPREAAPGGGEPWQVAKVYWVRVPRSWAEDERRALPGLVPASMRLPEEGSTYPPVVVDDGQVSAVVDATPWLPAKAAALRAHATQVLVEEPCFALSNHVAHLLRGQEAFELARGVPGAPDGWEDDLFAGVPDGDGG